MTLVKKNADSTWWLLKTSCDLILSEVSGW